MSYDEFIQGIIQSRGRHGCDEFYHERHHIIPKCLGGEDKEENYIDLYAREHFIAHELLAKENPHNTKLQFAWWCMAHAKDKNQERYKITPEEYEEAKIAIARANKKTFSGENNPMYGKHHSEATKQKIREIQQGRHPSEETKQKMSASLKGHQGYWRDKCRSEETKQKISKSNKGRNFSEETKRKMSKAKKGKPRSEDVKKRLSKPVLCIETGVVYYGAQEAKRQTGISQGNISACCRGELKTAGGYHWKYIEQ